MSFSPGRYVLSWADATGARDPFALQSQVKAMRDGFERAGHGRPALLLVVVQDGEEEAAVERIKAALDQEPRDAA